MKEYLELLQIANGRAEHRDTLDLAYQHYIETREGIFDEEARQEYMTVVHAALNTHPRLFISKDYTDL